MTIQHTASITAANQRGSCVIERKWGLMGSGCDRDMRVCHPVTQYHRVTVITVAAWHTGLIAGNNYKGLDQNMHTVDTHICVKGNQEADSDKFKHTHKKENLRLTHTGTPYTHKYTHQMPQPSRAAACYPSRLKSKLKPRISVSKGFASLRPGSKICSPQPSMRGCICCLLARIANRGFS